MTPGTDPATLRADLHEWLSSNRDGFAAALAGNEPNNLELAIAPELKLQQALWDAGFTKHGWPEFCGGAGTSAVLRAVVYEQLVLDGFRIPQALNTIETLGPAMVAMAPELSESYLPACLRGDEVWCQGFSEPEAGSDLASLRCRATADGDGWILSGQKIWSSLGTVSERIAMLARTGEAGHRGISMLLVDLDAPGCEVRAIRASSGRNEFAEVFFDDTPVAGERLVGELNRGWDVAMYLLQWERGMYAFQRQAILHTKLAEAARSVAASDHETRAVIAGAWILLTALRARSARTVRRLAEGENPGPEVSVDKILLSTAEQAVFDALARVHPTDFVLGDRRADEVTRGDWFYSRMASIYGGAVEIQRSIVAERVLGLPRGAR
jgi:acyl-CoA dehydrogenase